MNVGDAIDSSGAVRAVSSKKSVDLDITGDFNNRLDAILDRYPLLLVLLYRSIDQKLRDYLQQNLLLVDSLSGSACLVWIPEPADLHGETLRQRWTQRLGHLPDWMLATIEQPPAHFEDISCRLSQALKIAPEDLPAFAVAERHQSQCFCDRIPVEEDLQAVFNDIFGAAQSARDAPKGAKTKAFRKEWLRRRREQRYVGALKDLNKTLGEIHELESNILRILLPFAPQLESFLKYFATGR